MKVFIVIASLVMLASAEPPVGGGYSRAQARNNDAIEVSGGGYGGGATDNYVPQVYKHVYVHSAPDEPEDRQARTIRVPGGDKHVNVIFVKTPSSSSSQQTEVILPDQDEHKNLVYVLLKKAEAQSDIKIRRPQPKAPEKPEVHFIRYKQEEQQQAYGAPAQPAPLYGTPAAAPTPVRTPSNVYGTPSDVPPPTPSNTYGTPFH